MIVKRMAAAVAIASAVGTAGVGAAGVAQAQPAAPLPAYHWCPGQFFDPAWGNNFDRNRCHDDYYFDGEPHDAAHWHGYGGWHPDGPGPWDRGPGWENRGPGYGPPPPRYGY